MSKINFVCPLVLGFFIVFAQSYTEWGDNRIIGGEEVTNRSEFAFQVSIRNTTTNIHICGGIIIHKRAVLSAAHCFLREAPPRSLVVVAGDLDISAPSSETIYHFMKDVINNVDFNFSAIQHDTSLIFIEDEFTWTSTVNFLPVASVRPSVGTNCTVSGWGSLYILGPLSPVLMYAVVPILNSTECGTYYGDRILDGMVCAGYMEGGVDPCQGDSGGPLACDGYAVGVVSWGFGCAYNGLPGVYADVAYYKNWIETTIRDYLANENEGTTTTVAPTTVLPPDSTNTGGSSSEDTTTTVAPTTVLPPNSIQPGGSSVMHLGCFYLLGFFLLVNCVLFW